MLRRLALAALGVALLAGCGGKPAPVAAAEPGPRVGLAGGGERLDVRFACGDDTCAGWLYLPAGGARSPVVVMAHGLAGTRDVALPFFAERFAAAGLAAFVFDYRGFGASGGAPRQLVDPWRQLDDWRAAVAAMRGRQDLDAARLGLFGSSLGGGHALIVAAGDAGVRAVAAQVPLVDSGVEGEATFYGVGWLLRLLFTAWGDLALSLLGREPWLIPAIVPSGGFGMIADDAAARAATGLAEPGSSWRNEVVARSIFTFDEYNPAVQAASLEAPLLLVASRADRFAPFSAVEAFARDHPRARVAEIEGDHFEVYLAPVRERAAALAAAFLAEELAVAADLSSRGRPARRVGARFDVAPALAQAPEECGAEPEQQLVDERDHVGHQDVHHEQQRRDQEQVGKAQSREPRHEPADHCGAG